ncbi:MAG: hypothetical protein ABI333_29785 [bacterium]
MTRFGMLTLTGLLSGAIALSTAADARPLDDTKQGSAPFCRSPIVKRWLKLAPPRREPKKCDDTGRVHNRFQLRMNKQKPNLFEAQRGWDVFQGNKNPLELKFYVDSLAVTKISGGRDWFPIYWVEHRRHGPARAALGLYLYRHPKAADLIANAIATPQRVGLGWGNGLPTAWWALWYLGGKQHVDTIIRGFTAVTDRNRAITRHTNFVLSVLDRWKLTEAQIKKIEDFCLDKVFQPRGFGGAVLGCLRYLGRIQTKNKQLQQFIMQHFTGRNTIGSLEAVRALMGMAHKPFKKKAQANIKQAKRKYVQLGKRGRRKTVTGYSTHFHAVNSAMALLAMGDRKALKIIKGWVMTYDFQGFVHNEDAFQSVFREAAYAHPTALKKMKQVLRSAFKKAVKMARKNDRMKRVVRDTAVFLLQLGDKTGLKTVLDVIKDNDKKAFESVLDGMGAAPARTYFGWSGNAGVGHIKIGKNGLSVNDAQKLIKAIKARFMFYPRQSTRAAMIQAIADIEAGIHIAQKGL